MSTLKAKTIQPVSDSDPLILRTGASDSLTLDTNGNATIRGELTVDGIPIGQGPNNYDTNTRVGIGALNSTTSPAAGPWNTALGKSALSATNTGYYNTGLGGQALLANTTGIENTAVGLNSGKNNTTGNYNTAIGSQAGPNAGTRTGTTCIGRNAVASADNAVAIGYDSSATTANSIYLGNSSVTSLYMGNGSAVAPAFVARAWARITLYTFTAGGNLTLAPVASGNTYTFTFTTPMPNANYVVIATSLTNSYYCTAPISSITTTGFQITTVQANGTATAPAGFSVIVFG